MARVRQTYFFLKMPTSTTFALSLICNKTPTVVEKDSLTHAHTVTSINFIRVHTIWNESESRKERDT